MQAPFCAARERALFVCGVLNQRDGGAVERALREKAETFALTPEPLTGIILCDCYIRRRSVSMGEL
jgi:hypothetical protein